MARILLLLLFLLPLSAAAQLDTLVYLTPTDIRRPDQGNLRLRIDALAFLRDNEYKGRLVKGYTLPGMWIEPALTYQPLKNLRLELGLHLLHYWGSNRYPNYNYQTLATQNGTHRQSGFHCVPVFRAQLRPHRSVDVILGTLYGKANHQLIQPLYSDEANLTSDPETGLQVIVRRPHITLDTWVDWQTFIFRGDDRQESFAYGLSARLQPLSIKSATKLYFPVQAIFQHRGGEINPDAPDRQVKTWLNAAVGAGVTIPLRTRIPVALGFEADLAIFRQQAGTAFPFQSGHGIYATATAQVSRFNFRAAYWARDNFVTLYGNPLYGTMSIDEDALTYRRPQTLTFRAEYAQPLGSGFSWGISAETFATLPCTTAQTATSADNLPVTTLEHRSTDLSFAAGIFLRCRPSFLLKKILSQ